MLWLEMRSKIAILAGMIGNKVVQMAGRKGTSLTGKIALAVKWFCKKMW